LAMLSLLIAEITWVVMPYFEMSQYESYPDIFYMTYAMLSLVFPCFVLKHYKIRLNTIQYLTILLITILGILAYVGLSIDGMYYSSFNLGLAFTVLTSLFLGIGTVTLLSIRNTKIFRVWMIIVFSVLIGAVSDIWYYASENTENWAPNDWTNVVWFVSYLVMIFALSEQRHSYVTKEKKHL